MSESVVSNSATTICIYTQTHTNSYIAAKETQLYLLSEIESFLFEFESTLCVPERGECLCELRLCLEGGSEVEGGSHKVMQRQVDLSQSVVSHRLWKTREREREVCVCVCVCVWRGKDGNEAREVNECTSNSWLNFRVIISQRQIAEFHTVQTTGALGFTYISSVTRTTWNGIHYTRQFYLLGCLWT